MRSLFRKRQTKTKIHEIAFHLKWQKWNITNWIKYKNKILNTKFLMHVTSSIMPIPSKGKGQLFYYLKTAYLVFY